MKIELDSSSTHPYHINSYTQGLIVIGDEHFTSSLIITPSIMINNWAPKTFQDIATHHLNQIMQLKPEIILLGTGAKQHFLSSEISLSISELNIGFEVMDTGAACRSYNILLQEDRHVAAALLMIE